MIKQNLKIFFHSLISTKEVRIRIEKARCLFYQMKKVLCTLSLIIYFVYVSYDVMTLADKTIQSMDSFEPWCYACYEYRAYSMSQMLRWCVDKEVQSKAKIFWI